MFDRFSRGERTLELRLADFDLKDGDTPILEEYDPKTREYTGRSTSFNCERVEHSVENPLQFYNVKDVEKSGFWIIQLKKEK